MRSVLRGAQQDCESPCSGIFQVARIVPLTEEQALAEDDPIFRLNELAEPIGPLTNAEIDALVYDQ
jgi:hypothetical protein